MRKEKRVPLIGLVIGIIAIVCIILIIVVISKNGKKEVAINNEEPVQVKEIVQLLEDGTRLNISEKLNGVKTVEGLEIRNIQVTEKDGISVILANVTNNTGKELEGFAVDITFIDENGSVIAIVPGYIKELEAGESTQLNASATVDFVETYDVTIEKTK